MVGIMRIVILMLGLLRCHANPDEKERKRDGSDGQNHQGGVYFDSENQGIRDERLAGNMELGLKVSLRKLEENAEQYLKHQKRINMEFHNAKRELETILSDDTIVTPDRKRSDDSRSHHGQTDKDWTTDPDEIYSLLHLEDSPEQHMGFQNAKRELETILSDDTIVTPDRKRSDDSMSHHGQIYETKYFGIVNDNSEQNLKQQKRRRMMELHHGQKELQNNYMWSNIIAAPDRKRSDDSRSHHGQTDKDWTTDPDEIYSLLHLEDSPEQHMEFQNAKRELETILSDDTIVTPDRKRSDDSMSHHGQIYETKYFGIVNDNSEQNLKQQKRRRMMELHHGQKGDENEYKNIWSNIMAAPERKRSDDSMSHLGQIYKTKYFGIVNDNSEQNLKQQQRSMLMELHHGQKDVDPYLSSLLYRRKPRSDLKQFIGHNGENHRQLQVTNVREDSQSTVWMENLRMPVSRNEYSFFNQWTNLMESLTGLCSGERENLTKVDHKQALLTMGSSKNFMNIFWPFRFDVNIMNQRLALSGLTHKLYHGSDQDTKEAFFKVIADHQDVKPPSKPSEIVYSFDDPEVMKGLYRTGMLSMPANLKEASKNLLSKNERRVAIHLANKALELINMTDPELYQSIVQMIATIGFYWEDNPKYLGGSATSDIGIIWLNVYDLDDWTVTFMAEQIVHEFVHNSLFYAELVHGTYHHDADLSEARPMSAIRRTYRNYDKSFHAAYVSACLITLHTRIGEMGRAEELARTFPGAVADLNVVNDETGVLNRSGRSMLNFLNDYACLTRL